MKQLFWIWFTALALLISNQVLADVYFKNKNLVQGVDSVAAAASTTVLTTSSNYYQQLTGATTQTYTLPDATTMSVGRSFLFKNNSTGNATVNDNASGLVKVVEPGKSAVILLTANGAAAGTWTVMEVKDVGAVQAITSTDNAVARYDGTSGQVQDSTVIISDGGNLSAAGQIYSPLDTESGTGTTHTINFNDGNTTVLDLNDFSGDVTLSFNNAVSGSYYCIKVIQQVTPRTITWPASVKWPQGVACVLSTGNDNIDLVCGLYEGTNFLFNCNNNYQ